MVISASRGTSREAYAEDIRLRNHEGGGCKGERFATVITVALAIWNVGIAFVVGSAVLLLARCGWLKQ